jgi:hypothetical protein
MVKRTEEERAAIERARVISAKLAKVSVMIRASELLLRDVEKVMKEDYPSVAEYDTKEILELKGSLSVWHRAFVPVMKNWADYYAARRRG